MKTLFTLILILTTYLCFSQNTAIQLLQINSGWNLKNDIKKSDLPTSYLAHKIKVEHATLENQGHKFKESFAGKPLPILILKVNGKIKYQWTADLSFKLKVTKEEILDVVEKVLK
tara:strand:+ start:2562 stop:2906 length:345 start_codon:yes stop_codon:yes gene_type:complete